MKNALVIGGAGFIGSNLCHSLVSKGIDVYSLDNYSTGNESNHIEGVKYKKGDSKNINDISVAQDLDVIFHLGEYSRVEQSYAEPFYSASNINGGIVPVIEYCKRNGSKLIYSGSSTKFGNEESPYSIAKKANTIIVDGLCSILEIDYAITYFYNVYGKNEISEGKYATVIAKFIEAKKKGEKVTINKPGTQSRNFTHVDDIVRGLILVAEKGYGDLYGIGSDKNFSIIDLAKMIGVDYEMGESVRGNRQSSKLVTDKIKSLGWRCQNSLKDYIDKADA